MHVCMILDPDVCRYDECVYDACIYDPQSLTLIHVCMMHISMFLDPNACLYDAPMYDAYIYDPHSLSLMFVSMMRYFLVTEGRKEGRTDKPILGVGCARFILTHNAIKRRMPFFCKTLLNFYDFFGLKNKIRRHFYFLDV